MIASSTPWPGTPWPDRPAERRRQSEFQRRQQERAWQRIMEQFERDAEAAAVLKEQQRYESQQAFRRPPKRCGHGKPPMKKWGPRKR